MKSKFSHLLSPYTIAGKTFKNRILAAPHGTLHENDGGYMHQDYLDYCQVLIDGGVARISTLDNPVDPVYGGRGGARRFRFFDDPLSVDLLESVKQYNRMAHAAGVLTMIELSHGGKSNGAEPGYEHMMTADCALAVSPEPPGPKMEPMPGMPPMIELPLRVMEEQDIENIANQFAYCAKAVKDCGCDGVVVHGGHGQLFTQFLSSTSNRRTDKFGGSPENRARAPIMILQRIRDVCGVDFIIELRVSAVSEGEMEISLDETVEFAKMVDGLVDIFHVSSSVGTIPTSAYPSGLNVEYAAEIKKHVKMAVAVVGAINDPEMAEKIISEGKADFICSGRQLHLSDPRWPRKVMEGQPEMINTCLRCATGCTGDFLCRVNPVVQMKLHTDLETKPAVTPRKVVVIGGGIAGMKAAETAALRGHDVVLFEKSSTLGGVCRFADWDESKTDTKLFKDNMAARMKTLGVDVRLSIAATPELVAAEEPFAVIAALGAKQVTAVKGSAMNAMGAYSPNADSGGTVVVIGGGLTGVETALHLKRCGNDVVLIEAENRLLPTLLPEDMADFFKKSKPGGHYNPMELLGQLNDTGIVTRVNCKAEEVIKNGVVLADGEVIPCQKAVIATGVQPLTEQAEKFRGISPLFFNIGDSYEPGTIREAVFSGYRAAMSI